MNYNQTIQASAYRRMIGDYIRAYIAGDLTAQRIGSNAILVTNTQRNKVPIIRLPLVVNAGDTMNTTGKTLVFIDVSSSRGEDEDMMRVLGILTAAWESEEHRLTNLRRVGAEVYSKWISSTVTKRLGLTDYAAIARMEVYLALYFYCAGRDATEVLTAPSTLGIVAEITRSSASLVSECSTTILNSISDGVHAKDLPILHVLNIINHLSPVFEQKVTYTNIASSIGNTWAGEAGIFQSQLALEYPPALFAGAYIAYASKQSFKRTAFGLLVQKTIFANRNAPRGEAFVRQLNDIIGALSSAE